MCQEIKFAPYEHYFMRRSAADEAKTVQEEAKPIMSSSMAQWSSFRPKKVPLQYICSNYAINLHFPIFAFAGLKKIRPMFANINIHKSNMYIFEPFLLVKYNYIKIINCPCLAYCLKLAN